MADTEFGPDRDGTGGVQLLTRPCSVNRFIKPLVCRIVGQRF